MLTHHPNSELALLNSLSVATTTIATGSSLEFNDLQKVWHLFSLLISIGRPTSPHELASRSAPTFPASADLVRFLCCTPDSPITLTTCNDNEKEGIMVTISALGLLAFQRFASNFNLNNTFVAQLVTTSNQVMPASKEDFRVYFRKRKRDQFDSLEVHKKLIIVHPSAKRIHNDFSKVHFPTAQHIRRSLHVGPGFMSIKLNNIILPPNLFTNTIGNKLIYQLENAKQDEDATGKRVIVIREGHGQIMAPELEEKSICSRISLDSKDLCEEAELDEVDFRSKKNIDAAPRKDNLEENSTEPVLCANGDHVCNDASDCLIETEGVVGHEEELLTKSGNMKGEEASFLQPVNSSLLDISRESVSRKKNGLTRLDIERGTTCTKNQVSQKKFRGPSAKVKIAFGEAMRPRQESMNQSLQESKAVITPKENRHVKRNLTTIGKGQKTKKKHKIMHIKEEKNDLASFSPMDGVKAKVLPHFESYIVEEEEGSGGYGIVYRAQRKSDGATVAIKCPHAKAHRHHVSNEQRMLERFGGKNFVIKYEGCFKSGNSDCFVLEHVEHDRPEVLKKDIDLFQLRWYGYCMFRALASLHKQGIIHRDVKPGNFLFSRKTTRGYLIDFNLAMDLSQKYRTTNRLKTGNDAIFNPVALSNAKSAPTKSRRFPIAKSLNAVNREVTKGFNSTIELKHQTRKAVSRPKDDNNGCNITKSRGADVSGLTSVKDVTSTKTLSAERLREPLPSQGRKELICLLQEAMHSPNYEASSVASSKRKRVPALPRKVDERLIYLTPMPLQSALIAKDGRPKKEGPCVGTKGFRAPEILFRSIHQGPKVDVWSAGVTVLYLIIGRTPFYGDPEHNIKDIAKLRGSEDLWEVSKLHDRESSFPVELYSTEFFPSITLMEWCKINTKRRDFLDIIPDPLFDLLDKCLTVNPRLRISAEDALKHEFFAPCDESLRKQRQLRNQTPMEL